MRGGLTEKVVSPSKSRRPATMGELSYQRRLFEKLRLTGGVSVGDLHTCAFRTKDSWTD